jgi:ribosomal protein S18 acetylase RimI-like enzyme
MDVSGTGSQSPLPIRRADDDDYEQIVTVWSSCGLSFSSRGRESEQAFRRQLRQFPDLYLVATDGDRIAGVVLGSHDHRKGWINRVAVVPEYRRRGLATALVSACDAAIRAQGIEIVAALIEPDNVDSMVLFEKLGYRNDVPARYYRKLSHADA